MKNSIAAIFFMVFNQSFSQIHSYQCEIPLGAKGYCIAKESNKYGVVKNYKQVIIPFEFDTISEYENYTKNYYLIVKKNNKYGVYDRTGKQLIPVMYDKINIIYDLYQDLFALTQNNTTYVQLNKKLDKLSGAYMVSEKLYMSYYEVSMADWIFFMEDVIYNKRLDNIELQELIPDTNKINVKTLPYLKAYLANRDNSCKINKTYFFSQFKNTISNNFPCILNSDTQLKKLGNFPVTGITHQQAKLYCEWLSAVFNTLLLDNPDLNIQINFRLPNKSEWEEIAYKGLNDAMRKNNMFDSINTKNCNLFNYRISFPCKSYTEMVNTRGEGLTYVWDFFPNNIGINNMFGNVSEMLLEKGLSKGGNYAIHAKDCAIPNTQTYNTPQPWLGFRWVAELSVKQNEQ